MLNPFKKSLGVILFSFLTSITGFSQNLSKKDLIDHLHFLASDALQGRKTLSEGNLEARTYITEHFQKLENTEALYPDLLQYFSFKNNRENKIYNDAANVIAFIPGSESKKVIVITAHYDHVGIGRKNASGDSIYNGADDNASGTAALLALASYFSQNRPKHAILFAALDAEEMGLQGARALVDDFPYPLEQILLNVNMDMIGRNDQNELYASGTYHNPHLKPILEKAASGSGITLKFGHDQPGTGAQDWTRSSDHGAFFEKKIPHIYFGVEDHVDYHQPSDEIKGIQEEFFTNAAELVLQAVLAFDRELLTEKK
jgi:Zn-dependent M28 family amino/carboxypeptidase